MSIGEAWREHLLFALLTDAEEVLDRIFKGNAMEILLKEPRLRDEGVSRESLLLLVEELGGLRPRSRLWELVSSLPLLEEHGGRYRLRETIRLADLPAAGRKLPRALRDQDWRVTDLDALFFPEPCASWSVRFIARAVSNGYEWFLWTAHLTEGPDSDVDAMPAFWQCGKEGDTPLGYLRAVTSLGDTLGSLADSHFHPCPLTTVAGDHRAALDNLGRMLLDYRRNSEQEAEWDAAVHAWNHGGFWPFEDQPEADYPTVDATWDAVLALGSLHDQYDDLTARYGAFDTGREAIGAALAGGIRFLLRMQLPAGGWGIYRYPGDRVAVPPYEFTTAQTLLALALSLPSPLLDGGEGETGGDRLRGEVEAALRRGWAFLQERSVRFEGRSAWLPYLDDHLAGYGPEEVLRATVWCGTGLLALYRALPDLRAGIAPYLDDLIALAEAHWRPDYRRIAEVEFRVPRRERLHDSYGKWSNRYDVTVAILLLDLFNQGRDELADGAPLPWAEPGDALWGRLERTIGEILREQHPEHGHWHEPVADMPLAAATAMAIQALQLYLTASRHLAAPPARPAAPCPTG
ncbi:hypothetical protein [Endothiovibrio diazotrophicus]